MNDQVQLFSPTNASIKPMRHEQNYALKSVKARPPCQSLKWVNTKGPKGAIKAETRSNKPDFSSSPDFRWAERRRCLQTHKWLFQSKEEVGP